MTALDQCVHELTRAWCAICTPRSVTTVDITRIGKWFKSGYEGRCENCDTEYQPGDRIRASGEGGYLCTVCGDVG